jgi:hypothetical protein
MSARAPITRQPDLLDWKAPAHSSSFDERVVRASTIGGRMCRAMAVALKDAAEKGKSREMIAKAMGDYLGEPMSKNMLDAYVSEARVDHVISVTRFFALLHATQDRRLLEVLAEAFGWAVIERRHLPLIQVAALRDKQDELRRESDALMRIARREGAL